MGVRSRGFRKELRGGKPHWIIDFRYRDTSGVMRRFRRDASLQTATAAAAEAARLQMLAATNGSLDARIDPPTFATFVDETFRPIYMAARCRPATAERYEGLLRQGILDHFGQRRLDRIGAAEVRHYAALLAARGVQARGPLGLVRTVLRAAVELGALDRFPDLPRLPKPSKKLPDAPSQNEVEAMLAVASGWLRLAIALAAFAGLRQGEVRALEVRDVDLKAGCIFVRRAFSGNEVLTPKSGDERVVPIAPQLEALLANVVRGRPHAGRVVVNRRGSTPSRQHVLTVLKKLLARRGLAERSFHSLRHAFCSVLVRNGASLEAVRILAGHHDLKVTQRYVHANARDLREAIARGLGNGGETAPEQIC